MPSLKYSAQCKWESSNRSSPKSMSKILELSSGEDSVVFGTIFANLANKPDILKDLEGDISIPQSYLGDEGQYFIEDESGRVELALSNPLPNGMQLITGLCVALRGYEEINGKFTVTDYCAPGLAPLITHEVKYVAIVSGLEFGNEAQDDIAMDLLFDFLVGNVPSGRQTHNYQVSSVIFAGNNVCQMRKITDASKKKYGHEHAKYEMDSIKKFDQQISVLAQSIPVVIIPGSMDPTNCSLPQAPLKPGLLPFSSKFSSVKLLGNPSSVTIDETSIMLAAGQNLDDMARYCQSPDRLELAKLSLQFRHLAPSAPDTLWCYPFFEKDPFVLENSPHCYVVGNQPAFATALVQSETPIVGLEAEKVRLILSPSFSTSKSIVLLNLKDLTCRLLSFI